MTAVGEAQHLFASGDTDRAIACLDRAAAQGDELSWLELGLLFLSGKHVARDLARARECFGSAGKLGNSAARHIHIQLVALGVGGEAEWSKALTELRAMATNDEVAATQVRLLDAMDLSSEGTPSRDIVGHQLSSDPHVWSFDGFFSPAESSYLIARARPLLQPSLVVDPATGALTPNPVRTSHAMSFPWVSEDLVIQALNRRIALASSTSPEFGEPLQILRYAPGQQYRPHFDAFDRTDNQRLMTMLVYLNDDYDGGQTVFTHNGLTFRGRAGDGLLFRNATQSGARDETAQHAGLPVRRGEKWLASRWIRERPLVALRS
jgi:prolyl 4-hydroxylase